MWSGYILFMVITLREYIFRYFDNKGHNHHCKEYLIETTQGVASEVSVSSHRKTISYRMQGLQQIITAAAYQLLKLVSVIASGQFVHIVGINA